MATDRPPIPSWGLGLARQAILWALSYFSLRWLVQMVPFVEISHSNRVAPALVALAVLYAWGAYVYIIYIMIGRRGVFAIERLGHRQWWVGIPALLIAVGAGLMISVAFWLVGLFDFVQPYF